MIGWFFSWRQVVISAVFFFSLTDLPAQQSPVYKDFSGNVGLEYRGFFNDGMYPAQKQHFTAISLQPEYLIEWQNGKYAVNFTGFARLDFIDGRRSHWDIRELYFQTVGNNWDLSVGVKKVYWGVTEAVHLVDVINQTDNLETFDGEQKLGQPMIHYSYLSNLGTVDFFVMSYFRKRQFPGSRGRLRTPIRITDELIGFEDDMKESRPDLAVRWSHYLGPIDFGISHFYGTGREPIITSGLDGNSELSAVYPIINQTGIDVQATTGPVLWKLESIVRTSEIQDMFALDVGFEYTFGNIGGTGVDLGVIGEYLYDDRGDYAFSSMQSDVFVGGRLAFNDTQSSEFLFGGILDLERSTKLFSVEGSRRFGESFKGSLEVRWFADVSENEFLYLFRDDSFVKAEWGWYF